jgi:hypothetical protein
MIIRVSQEIRFIQSFQGIAAPRCEGGMAQLNTLVCLLDAASYGWFVMPSSLIA